MAFVCTLPEDGFNAAVHRRGSSRIVIANIGVDDSAGLIYSILVALDAAPGVDGELIFCVIEAGEDHERECWSGLHTSEFLIGEDRKRVMNAIESCVASLIRTDQPGFVTMCTHEAGLPQAALSKYIRIARVVEMCGYIVSQPDRWHGKHIWYMERRPDAAR